MLNHVGDAAFLTRDRVERSPLVGILAIAKRLKAVEGEAEKAGQAVPVGSAEIGGDGRVVGTGMGEDLGRELPPELVGNGSGAQRLEDAPIIGRVDDDQ